MRYANIDCNTIGIHRSSDECYLNWGDHIQILAIDYIYQLMRIPMQDIIRIPFDELQTYNGEQVILPINFLLFLPFRKDGALFSPKIHPVFLGAAFSGMSFSDQTKQYFQKYAPIGCRDENIYNIFKKNGINAYLNGCMTATLPLRENNSEESHNKILFIDVPKEVIPYVPNEILTKAEFRTNAIYGPLKKLIGERSPRDAAIENYRYIAKYASLVVTSRLHIASPCIAMGIPVILVKNKISTHFAWIEKYIPIYSSKLYSTINWAPRKVEYENEKAMILEHAINRIKYENQIAQSENQIHNFYMNRERHAYEDRDPLNIAIKHIEELWDKNYHGEYAIWGITSVAEGIYDYISRNYPYLQLSCVIDKYKRGDFHGVNISSPNVLNPEFSPFLFVTTAGGAAEAKKALEETHICPNKYHIIVPDIATCK